MTQSRPTKSATNSAAWKAASKWRLQLMFSYKLNDYFKNVERNRRVQSRPLHTSQEIVARERHNRTIRFSLHSSKNAPSLLDFFFYKHEHVLAAVVCVHPAYLRANLEAGGGRVLCRHHTQTW